MRAFLWVELKAATQRKHALGRALFFNYLADASLAFPSNDADGCLPGNSRAEWGPLPWSNQRGAQIAEVCYIGAIKYTAGLIALFYNAVRPKAYWLTPEDAVVGTNTQLQVEVEFFGNNVNGSSVKMWYCVWGDEGMPDPWNESYWTSFGLASRVGSSNVWEISPTFLANSIWVWIRAVAEDGGKCKSIPRTRRIRMDTLHPIIINASP